MGREPASGLPNGAGTKREHVVQGLNDNKNKLIANSYGLRDNTGAARLRISRSRKCRTTLSPSYLPTSLSMFTRRWQTGLTASITCATYFGEQLYIAMLNPTKTEALHTPDPRSDTRDHQCLRITCIETMSNRHDKEPKWPHRIF